MGAFPYSFNTSVSGISQLDAALSANFVKAATEDWAVAQIDAAVAGVTAGIVTDHGSLTGLTDDDHPQYHDDARGDARYVKSDLSNVPAGLATQAELDAESSARSSGDSALDARLDAIEADYSTSSETAAAVAGEASLRAAADTALDGRLDAIEAVDYATQAELADHVSDAVGAHAATAISYAGGTSLPDDTVEEALDRLGEEKADYGFVSASIADHLVTSHVASAISIVDADGWYTSGNVEGALDEIGTTLDGILSSGDASAVQANLDAHIADTVDAHDASAISATDSGRTHVVGDDVQEQLGQADNAIISVSNGLSAHISDTDDAHDASAVSVTSTGIIIPSSSSVQVALAQVEAYTQNLREEFEQHNHDDRYRNVVTNGYQQMVANKDDTLNNGGVGTAALSITVEGNGIDYMWLEFWAPNQICLNGSGRMLAVIREGTTAGTDRGFHNKFAPGPSNLDGGHVHVRYRMDPFTGSKTFVAFQININIGAGAQLRIEANTSAPAFLRATWDR